MRARSLRIRSALQACAILVLMLVWGMASAAHKDREPQGVWAQQVPQVAAYVAQLNLEQRQELNRLRAEFAGIDPTDVEAFARAILAKRQEYGAQLNDAESAAYHAWLQASERLQQALVHARGRHIGIAVNDVEVAADDVVHYYTLIGFNGIEPLYATTSNANAAESTAANLVRGTSYDPSLGAAIDGTGLYVNINDHGTIYEHPEFQLPTGGSRILVTEVNDSGNRSHMTHVAGTVGAWGVNASAMGMAPRVWFRSLIQQSSSDITGYGMRYPGQEHPEINPRTAEQQLKSVAGNTSLGLDDTTAKRGLYYSTSATFDSILSDYPYYTHFYAAGNDGGSGYASINMYWQVSKNIVTVGNAQDAVRDDDGHYVSGGSINGSSSRGPTYDGRIKPDLAANGTSLYSPSSATGYGNKTGTSMASPNACGSVVLLIDYIGKKFPGHFWRSSTLRALAINAATDRGTPGPDYTYGFGLVNIKAAADIVKRFAADPSSRVVLEDELSTAETWSQAYTYDGTGEISVTLSWLDPPGETQSVSTADHSPRLTNDLNLRVIGPDGSIVHLPWVMPFTIGSGETPAWDSSLYNAAAVTGVNVTDVNEQVRIAAPAAGTYTVEVSHAGDLVDGSQLFSLAVSGMAAGDPVAPWVANVTPSVSDGSDGMIVTLSGGDLLLGTDVLLRRDGSDALIEIPAYGEMPRGDAIECRLDTAALTPGYWDVVVQVPGAAEVVLPNGFLVPSGAEVPPVFTSTPPTQATVGDAFSYTITTSDADTPAADLVLTAAGLPDGLSFAANGNGGGSITGSPTSSGSATIVISVTDGIFTTWQLVDLIILPVGGNTVPVIVTTTLPDAHVGERYSAVVSATDADGHALTLSATSKPSWLQFTDNGDNTATLSGTPGSGDVGNSSVTVEADDSLQSSTAVLALTVRPRAVVSFASATASIGEDGETIELSVGRSGNDAGSVSVNYATAPGSASSGADFVAASDSLTWPDGDTTSHIISVPINQDQFTEGSESFTVTLSSLSGIADLGTATVTVTITDDDNNAAPSVSIVSPVVAVNLVERSNLLHVSAAISDDGQPTWGSATVSWTQVSGPDTAIFADPAAADTSISFPADGAYVLQVEASDGEFSASVERMVVVGAAGAPVPGTGVEREYYGGISGTAVADLTSSAKFINGTPDSVTVLDTLFEAPSSVADSYGQRVHGFFIPSQTGDHTFVMASDDGGELWLSTDADPANKVLIAWVSGWTSSRQWNPVKYASQLSSPIGLVAGQPYYIEALMKEGGGGDNLAVGVTHPDTTEERPITAAHLALPAAATAQQAPVLTGLSASPGAGSASVTATATDDGLPDPPASLALTWSKVSGPGTVNFADPTAAYTTATFLADGDYVLRLTATDGDAVVSEDLSVTITGASGARAIAVVVSSGGSFPAVTVTIDAGTSGEASDLQLDGSGVLFDSLDATADHALDFAETGAGG